MAVGVKVNGTNRITRHVDYRARRARMRLKAIVASDTDQYVPMRSGDLKNSVTSSIGRNDPYIVYNRPSARFLYRGLLMVDERGSSWAKKYTRKHVASPPVKLNYHKGSHPNASAEWFEVAKSKKGKEWIRDYAKEFKL